MNQKAQGEEAAQNWTQDKDLKGLIAGGSFPYWKKGERKHTGMRQPEEKVLYGISEG